MSEKYLLLLTYIRGVARTRLKSIRETFERNAKNRSVIINTVGVSWPEIINVPVRIRLTQLFRTSVFCLTVVVRKERTLIVHKFSFFHNGNPPARVQYKSVQTNTCSAPYRLTEIRIPFENTYTIRRNIYFRWTFVFSDIVCTLFLNTRHAFVTPWTMHLFWTQFF